MKKPPRSPLLVAACALLLLTSSSCSDSGSNAAPKIGHVFTIVLENEDFETVFGPNSAAPYLANTLTSQGALLSQFYGTGHFSLDNYVAMVSGQSPNNQTQSDCLTYTEFVSTGVAPDDQLIGSGCVYPTSVETVANQLEGAGLSWKAYMEDMGNDPSRESATCAHPPIGAPDNTQKATVGDQYATRHNPFMYFHSIIDSPSCQTNVVNLDALPHDLQSVATTPNYVFITPNLCHDGHDSPCVNGEPGGLISADQFLQTWVPRITSSPAFQQDGLLIITFDEAEIEVTFVNGQLTIGGDASACCDEQPGPNSNGKVLGVQATGPGIFGPGGGVTGEVLLSRFISPGTVSNVPYNHYSQLKSIEDLFGLGHLGYAAPDGLKGFGSDVFTNPNG